MMINFSQFTALFPFFIIMCTLIILILSISYHRNIFFICLFSTLTCIISFFSTFLFFYIVPIDINFLFRIDSYSALCIGMIVFSSISSCILSYPILLKTSCNKEEFYLLILISTLGAMLLSISNHMSSFFINMELTTLPMLGLINYFNKKKYSLESSFKYMILCGVSSSFMLMGIAWIYSVCGNLSFSFSNIDHIIASNEMLVMLFGISMILLSLFFKLSIVPFHLWTPDIYYGTPSIILSFIATITKISAFSLIVHFLLNLNFSDDSVYYFIISLFAILSVLIGNIMAIFQNNIKRFFGYASISQLGYLFISLLSLKNNTLFALESSAIYLYSYLFGNIACFGILHFISDDNKKNNSDLISSYQGLFWSHPFLSILFTIVLLSFSGFPMTLGFIGKFYILSIIVQEHFWITGLIFFLGSVLGFYAYLRMIVNLYLPISNVLENRLIMKKKWFLTPSGLLIFFTSIVLFILGVYPNPLMNAIKLSISL